METVNVKNIGDLRKKASSLGIKSYIFLKEEQLDLCIKAVEFYDECQLNNNHKLYTQIEEIAGGIERDFFSKLNSEKLNTILALKGDSGEVKNQEVVSIEEKENPSVEIKKEDPVEIKEKSHNSNKGDIIKALLSEGKTVSEIKKSTGASSTYINKLKNAKKS